MKIGIAQINPTVGDFKGNAKRILSAYREAIDKGADLVVTPELSLFGYPAGDLVLKKRFMELGLQALDYIIDEVGEVGLLVGYIDNNVLERSEKEGRLFRNAAVLIQNKKIIGQVFKTLLPTYDIYDENHYFEPSESCEPIRYNGHKLGVTICEDLWSDELIERPLYDRDPAKELKEKRAQIIINMSTSHFQVGRPQFRANLLEVISCGTRLPVVYCNAVGGNGQFIFDGHSMALDDEGNVLTQLKGFEECVEVCDVTLDGESPPYIPGKSIEHLHKALVMGIRDYVVKLGLEEAVVAISGGVDSSVTLALAVEALGASNVIALSLPSKFSDPLDTADALILASKLGVRCESISVDDSYEAIANSAINSEDGVQCRNTETNIKSRLRAIYIMAAANKYGYLPLSTLNKSDMFTGNYTVYGDCCLGLSVLGDVPKMMVYQLAKEINAFDEIISADILDTNAMPEFLVGDVKGDSVPSYKVIDRIIEYYVIYGLSNDVIIKDFGFSEHDVRWVQRRIDLNEWKRQQTPPVLRVTSPGFGRGRRLPIVQRYVD